MTDNDYPTLNDADAIALWKQGKDVWNQWVEDNPNYNIDFSYVDFSKEVFEGEGINFSGFCFPNGNLSFSNAFFGNGRVSFFRTKFGNGTIDFMGARFGDGDVHFTEAKFESGNVYFWDSKFGDGNVSFSNVKFGDGDVHFTNAKFGDGDVHFANAKFGDGNIDFHGAKFEGTVLFKNLKNLKYIKNLSFKYATFDGPLDISSKETFPCLIDLTHTKTSHHVSLHGLNCTLPRKSKGRSRFFPNSSWMTHKVAIDPEDEDRTRRLKELAEANKDHEKAKEFHIMEMQAKREFNSPFGFLLTTEFWYEKLSDYGRSITLPLDWLFSIFLMGLGFYSALSIFLGKHGLTFWDTLQKSAIFSATQMFSFIPSNRLVQGRMIEALFCKEAPDIIFFMAFFQSGCALILLFLLGLGLRHRYRI